MQLIGNSIVAEMARLGVDVSENEPQLRRLPHCELRLKLCELSYAFYALNKARATGLKPLLLEKHLWKRYRLIEGLLGKQGTPSFPPGFQQRLMDAASACDEGGVRALYAELRLLEEA